MNEIMYGSREELEKEVQYRKTHDAIEVPKESIPHPICPINQYFEGDEDMCNIKVCDWDMDSRSCTEGCKIAKKITMHEAMLQAMTEEMESRNSDTDQDLFQEWIEKMFEAMFGSDNREDILAHYGWKK